MKKIKLLLFSIFCIHLSPCVQAQNLATTIKVQAMEMADALMKNDFSVFVKYMHPDIVAFAGGNEKMKAKMDSAYQAMKRFNVRFKKYWIGNPGEIVNHNDQLQAVLPQRTTLVTPLGELTAESAMIVISNDNGKTWWFIDTNVYTADRLKSILPGLSNKLVVPPKKKPQLVPAGNSH